MAMFLTLRQKFQHFLEDIRREYDKMNPVRNCEVGGTI